MTNKTRFNFTYVDETSDVRITLLDTVRCDKIVLQFAQFMLAAGYDQEDVLESMEMYIDTIEPALDADEAVEIENQRRIDSIMFYYGEKVKAGLPPPDEEIDRGFMKAGPATVSLEAAQAAVKKVHDAGITETPILFHEDGFSDWGNVNTSIIAEADGTVGLCLTHPPSVKAAETRDEEMLKCVPLDDEVRQRCMDEKGINHDPWKLDETKRQECRDSIVDQNWSL